MSEQMAGAVSVRPSRGRWYILLMIARCTSSPISTASTSRPRRRRSARNSASTRSPWASSSAPLCGPMRIFQVPGGWLSDRFGARPVLATIVAYWSVMTAATAMATGAVSFFVIRFLFGAGEAGAFPGATRAMQVWYPRPERGFVQGHHPQREPARRRHRAADRGLDHDHARLAIGVLHLRRGRIRLVAVVVRELPQPAGRARPGEPRGVGAHPRFRRNRRDQPGCRSKERAPTCRGGRCCDLPTCGRSCAPTSPTFIASTSS